MSPKYRRFLDLMMKKLFALTVLLALGCSAQQPVATQDLNRKIERQIRSTFNVPGYVELTVGPKTNGSDIAGYDKITVTFSRGESKQTHDFLVSKDGKTLLSVTTMPLDKDPYAETMAKIDTTGRPFRGAKDAKVTVVVYDDFQCPFCTRMHTTLFNDVMKSYGDRVKVIYKDYPLFEIHPWAGRAAVDSGCLADQSMGAYWEFADYVHANPKAISGDKRPLDNQLAEVDKVALDLGKKHSVDAARLDKCVKDQSRAKLEASVKEAESLGVQATPALFINGMKMDGAVPSRELRMVLNQALKDAGEQPVELPKESANGGQ
jgi:protein-disulfide isomerase